MRVVLLVAVPLVRNVLLVAVVAAVVQVVVAARMDMRLVAGRIDLMTMGYRVSSLSLLGQEWLWWNLPNTVVVLIVRASRLSYYQWY